MPSGSDDCDDALTLLDHYRVQRYPGHDLQFLPEVNDPAAANNPTPYTDHMSQFGTCNVPLPVPVAATSIRVKDDQARPERRKLRLRVSTRNAPELNRVVPPAPGSDGDPTLSGGLLIVYDSAGGPDATTISLPASGWELLGSPANPRGYRYHGTGQADPVTKVIVKENRIRVVAGGANFGYGLGDAPQGRVAVRLELGTQVVWCTDTPARGPKYDTTERFVGMRNARAGELCAPVPG